MTIDLKTITGGPSSTTTLILGCSIKGSGNRAMDPKDPRTYIDSSTKTAAGRRYLPDGTFVVDLPAAASLDVVAFQDAYIKPNKPAVAKVLAALANLISPEVV